MKKKNTLILFVGLFAFILLAGGISYGYFVYNKEVATVDLTSGEIAINYASGNSNITLSNVMTMSDGQGMISNNYLDFNVVGKADIETILYELEVVSSNPSLNDYIKVYLTDQEDNSILSPFNYNELYDSIANDGKALYQGLMEGNQDGTSKTTTNNYRLRVWLDESYTGTTTQSFTISTYMYAKNIDTTNLHQVTFNTQDGRSNGPVKYVTLGEEYGVMPTPMRDGYTFLGWNGKNLLSNLVKGTGISSSNGMEISNANMAASTFIPADFSNNQVYTLSGLTNSIRSLIGAYDESKNFLGRTSGNQRYNIIGFTANSFTAIPIDNANDVRYMRVVQYKVDSDDGNGSIDDIDNLKIQLEIGSVITEYEPYYVTSDIEVTARNDDYVMKAIWQENS